jgi:penicillin-binding protein 1C
MRVGKSLNNFFFRFRGRYLAVVGVTAFLVAIVFIWSSTNIRSLASVHKSYQPSDVWIVDHQGYPMESIRTGEQKRSLEWVEWSDVSPAFRDLLVQAEDRRFYSHPGVDLLAISKALWERVLGHSYRGASTLTMQLIGLLKDGTVFSRRTIKQKITQIIAALKLNAKWSKEEILEAYVNLVSFRGELVGLRAASLGYFGKNPSGLVREEAALLIGLLRSPNSTPDLVAKRACRILKESNCQSLESLSQQTFSHPYSLLRAREMVPVLSKYFVENGLNESVIRTSLDYRVQSLALKALREQLRALRNQNMKDGAVLILETKSGRAVAYIANGGAGVASSEQIDGIQTRRQAGSTIKPFVYATAFDWRLLTPAALIEDSPADIPISQGRGVYHPKNYDQIFRGLVSAGEALGSSMNVPTVRALQLVGESRVLDRLRTLGFERLQDDEYYGPSLALGAIDVTLWELTQGYRQFAISGSAFSEKTRKDIFNVLASPEYRRFTFGMDSLLTLPFPAAVKTGTSKDMRDNWCIGWTPQYTIGVWVGNFNGEPMWNVSGMSGAAPIWRSLMLALHPNPKGSLTNYEMPSTPLPSHTMSRIRYPAADMLVGFDPDIPLLQQKLPIEIENPQRGDKVYLNKRLLSKAQETTLWPLKKGKYKVELKSSSNQVVDSVSFEVR